MKDTFDLTKFLKENKSLENLNPTFKSLNEEESREERADVDKYEYEKGKKAGMKAKIREYILSELELDIDDSDKTDAELNADYDPVYEGGELEEAKKDKEADIEDVNIEDTTIEDVPAKDAPIEDVPATGGGLEDIAADMKGTEADLMDHLMKSFQIAKGMQNEKLETQIGNTLKFFVSEYIGGGEQ